jgi:single-strand DNA-binding protein
MASFAKIALLGNLGADPETKYTPNGAMVVELRIAVNPRPRGQGREEGPPTWYRVSAWDRLAERLDKLAQAGHVAKGRSLFVEGRLEPREFTGSDGQVRTSMDVTMTDFQFVGGDRREGEGGQGGYSGGQGGYQQGGNRGGYGQDDGTGGGYNSGGSSRSNTYDDGDQTSMDDVPF